MAPKPKGKAEAGRAVDEDALAECNRLQMLAYEGVRVGPSFCADRSQMAVLPHHQDGDPKLLVILTCVPRCCPSPVECVQTRQHPAKVGHACKHRPGACWSCDHDRASYMLQC